MWRLLNTLAENAEPHPNTKQSSCQHEQIQGPQAQLQILTLEMCLILYKAQLVPELFTHKCVILAPITSDHCLWSAGRGRYSVIAEALLNVLDLSFLSVRY